ncbi:MAG: hypothetical protein HY552_05640 [Elusimicrobia bacterium]|nr:hypothetical protein [Elusimicrobiota bacterium]
MREIAVGLLPLTLACLAAAGPVEGGWEWRETLTPHFRIQHQETWIPSGLTLGVERAHFRLRMDLGALSPWLSRERIGLYLYRDLDSYVGGQFQPPAWSNGVAVYERKAVALPAMKKTPEMLRVIAHETAHLLFVGYFRERRRDPPYWLNEGLAMVEETDASDRPETSPWYQEMAAMDPKDWYAMADFLALSPIQDLGGDQKAVGRWYVQAYAVTRFLLRGHSRLQFKSFCSDLRDGRTAAEALARVYRYRDPEDFEKRWRLWLADPVHRRLVAALPESARPRADGIVRRSAVWHSSMTAFGDFQPLTLSSRVNRGDSPAK